MEYEYSNKSNILLAVRDQTWFLAFISNIRKCDWFCAEFCDNFMLAEFRLQNKLSHWTHKLCRKASVSVARGTGLRAAKEQHPCAGSTLESWAYWLTANAMRDGWYGVKWLRVYGKLVRYNKAQAGENRLVEITQFSKPNMSQIYNLPV